MRFYRLPQSCNNMLVCAMWLKGYQTVNGVIYSHFHPSKSSFFPIYTVKDTVMVIPRTWCSTYGVHKDVPSSQGQANCSGATNPANDPPTHGLVRAKSCQLALQSESHVK